MALFPVQIEGPITSVSPAGDGAVLTVMGMTVLVSRSAGENRRIVTPDVGPADRHLSIAELLSTLPLPGRTAKGFVGGTAVVTGNFNSKTGRVEVVFKPGAPDDQSATPFEENPKLEVGPPESLILGPVTAVDGGEFFVNGVAVRRLDASDDRLRGLPPQNEFGFDIRPDSVRPGMAAGVDGYHSEVDAKFVGYNFVVDDPRTRLTTALPQVSILRAGGRNRGAEFDVDVRGGVTTAHAAGGSQTLEVFRIDKVDGVDTEAFLGRTQARVIPGGFAKWRLNVSLTALAPPYDVAPSSIVVRNVDAPGAVKPSARKNDIDVRDG